MPGLLELAQHDKAQALQGFGQAAQLEQRRDDTNKQLQQQATAQRKQAIGSAIGTGASVAMAVGGGMGASGMGALAAGGPAGLAVGGLMLLGSLF